MNLPWLEISRQERDGYLVVTEVLSPPTSGYTNQGTLIRVSTYNKAEIGIVDNSGHWVDSIKWILEKTDTAWARGTEIDFEESDV